MLISSDIVFILMHQKHKKLRLFTSPKSHKITECATLVLLKSKLQTQVLFQIKTMYRLRPSTIYGWFLSKSYEGRLAGKLFWPVALLAPCCFNNLEMCINNSEVRWMTLGPELCLALGWSQYFHLTLYANEVTWFRNPFLTVSVECSGQYRGVLCFSPHLLYLFYIFYI